MITHSLERREDLTKPLLLVTFMNPEVISFVDVFLNMAESTDSG